MKIFLIFKTMLIRFKSYKNAVLRQTFLQLDSHCTVYFSVTLRIKYVYTSTNNGKLLPFKHNLYTFNIILCLIFQLFYVRLVKFVEITLKASNAKTSLSRMRICPQYKSTFFRSTKIRFLIKLARLTFFLYERRMFWKKQYVAMSTN